MEDHQLFDARETVLIGDSRTDKDRILRQQLFFAEPNSGRFTLREKTGHAGGCSTKQKSESGLGVQPIRSQRLPPPSARLDKIVSISVAKTPRLSTRASCKICGDGISTTRRRYNRCFCGSCSARVANGGARGSSVHTNSNLYFQTTLRPGNGKPGQSQRSAGPGRQAEKAAAWRRVAGFRPSPPPAAPVTQRGAEEADTPSSSWLVERAKAGFKDKGLRRYDPLYGGWTSQALDQVQPHPQPQFQDDGDNSGGGGVKWKQDRLNFPSVQTEGPTTKQHFRAVQKIAGGPAGKYDMLTWNEWKKKKESHKQLGKGNGSTSGLTGQLFQEPPRAGYHSRSYNDNPRAFFVDPSTSQSPNPIASPNQGVKKAAPGFPTSRNSSSLVTVGHNNSGTKKTLTLEHVDNRGQHQGPQIQVVVPQQQQVVAVKGGNERNNTVSLNQTASENGQKPGHSALSSSKKSDEMQQEMRNKTNHQRLRRWEDRKIKARSQALVAGSKKKRGEITHKQKC